MYLSKRQFTLVIGYIDWSRDVAQSHCIPCPDCYTIRLMLGPFQRSNNGSNFGFAPSLAPPLLTSSPLKLVNAHFHLFFLAFCHGNTATPTYIIHHMHVYTDLRSKSMYSLWSQLIMLTLQLLWAVFNSLWLFSSSSLAHAFLPSLCHMKTSLTAFYPLDSFSAKCLLQSRQKLTKKSTTKVTAIFLGTGHI